MSNQKALIAEKPTTRASRLQLRVCQYFHYKPHLPSLSNSSMGIKITAGRNLSNEAQAFLLKGKRINWFIRLYCICVRFANRKVHLKFVVAYIVEDTHLKQETHLAWNFCHMLVLNLLKKGLSCAVFLHVWENKATNEEKKVWFSFKSKPTLF